VVVALLAVAVLVLARGAEAQGLQTRLQRDVMVGSGLHYQSWSRDGHADISELSIPLVFIWPMSRKMSLDVVTGSGFASLADDAGSLSGLTDVKIRASYIIGDEAALLTVGVSAPTGQTGLDEDQQEVSNSLAQSALSFRTPNFGQGLDVNLGLAMARKMGETVFGLGVGYLLKGEFTPSLGGDAYTPGSELSLTIGLDRKLMDGDAKLTLDAIYTLYSDDEQAGTKTFHSGNKLLVQELLNLRVAGLDWQIHAAQRIRENSERFRGEIASQVENGMQVEAGVTATKNLSSEISLRGLFGLKQYADNVTDLGAVKMEQGEAAIITVGPGLRFQLGPGRYLDLNAQYGTGEMDTDSVSGIEISGGIWIRL